jgi:hypothetical protein
MFKLYAQLPKSDSDIRKHVDALQQAIGKDKLFDHLYGCLTILDSKSSSLLAFNSIIIAVFSVFLAGQINLGLYGGICVGVGMVAVIVSCFLLLWVVWVHWSTTTDFSHSYKDHAFHLLKVRIARTLKYRLAWYFSVTSLLGLSAFLVGKPFHWYG